MKKSTAMLALLLVAASAGAQVKWSVNAGMVNTNNYETDSLSGGPDYSRRTGFTLGGIAAVKLFKSLWSETGISFYQKGYRRHSGLIPDYVSTVSFKVNYLALNQNILVKIAGKNDFSFSTGTGFFVAAGLNGRYFEKHSGTLSFIHREGNIKFGNRNEDDFKTIDAGLNMLVRSQYKNIQLTMQYSASFTNHIADSYGSNEKLRSLSVTLGYVF
jgi:hypothetical protein